MEHQVTAEEFRDQNIYLTTLELMNAYAKYKLEQVKVKVEGIWNTKVNYTAKETTLYYKRDYACKITPYYEQF